jgi:hypothetical protein
MLQSKKLARREVLCGGGVAALVVAGVALPVAAVARGLVDWQRTAGDALSALDWVLREGKIRASTVLRATHSYVASAEGLRARW